MDLAQVKLAEMAHEDGVSEDEFFQFAISVCEKVIEHSPSGSFLVLLPKTGHRHPLGVSLGSSSRNMMIELLYQLRECAPGEQAVTMLASDGSRQQTLVVRI